MCLLSCNQELQMRLYDEIRSTLPLEEQFSLKSEIDWYTDVLDCYANSKTQEQVDQCLERIGGNISEDFTQSLSLAAVRDSSAPRNFFTDIMIFALIAAVVAGIYIALKRSKKSEFVKQSNTNILEKDTFTVQQAYETLA